MSCEDCTLSAAGEHHGFTDRCKGCAARAIARGPNYFTARSTGRQDWRYRAELQLLGVTHDQVKAAAAADALGREKAS